MGTTDVVVQADGRDYTEAMGRLFLSLLLIANLLVCPIRCASSSAAQSVSTTDSQPACCCCHQECDPPEPECPVDVPGEDHKCKDCVCEGGTMLGADRVPDPKSVAACIVVLIDVDSIAGSLLNTSSLSETDSKLCGRGMRIAYQSLLN